MRPELQRPPQVPDTLTPGDQLLAAGLGVGAAAGGLVWASGQLAGLVFGHTWLHLNPADLAGVLWSLPHHLGDPALAWPANAREALPGPVGMYGAFTATTAAAAGVAGGVMRLWQRAGLGNPTAPGARVKRPAAGSATWASPRELRPLRVRRPQPGRVILGRTGGLGGRLLAGEDCHSVLVFGPPDSFKTTGLVIPAILEWTGPVLATSVKPDVIKATRAHRERLGEVVVFDPLGASGLTTRSPSSLATARSTAPSPPGKPASRAPTRPATRSTAPPKTCWPSTPTSASKPSPAATTWTRMPSCKATTPCTCTPRSTSNAV
jgi:type IV secretion system protein VirD4